MARHGLTADTRSPCTPLLQNGNTKLVVLARELTAGVGCPTPTRTTHPHPKTPSAPATPTPPIHHPTTGPPHHPALPGSARRPGPTDSMTAHTPERLLTRRGRTDVPGRPEDRDPASADASHPSARPADTAYAKPTSTSSLADRILKSL